MISFSPAILTDEEVSSQGCSSCLPGFQTLYIGTWVEELSKVGVAGVYGMCIVMGKQSIDVHAVAVGGVIARLTDGD